MKVSDGNQGIALFDFVVPAGWVTSVTVNAPYLNGINLIAYAKINFGAPTGNTVTVPFTGANPMTSDPLTVTKFAVFFATDNSGAPVVTQGVQDTVLPPNGAYGALVAHRTTTGPFEVTGDNYHYRAGFGVDFGA